VTRTQIYLDEEIQDYLRITGREKQSSYSEIIRESIRHDMENQYGLLVSRMEKAAGAWEINDQAPEDYVDDLRRDRPL
jgi:hypothetical protein